MYGSPMKVMVTGATGYIGGRLVPRLLDAGIEVRCMTRDPEQLAMAPWRDKVEVIAADALDRDALPVALAGCDAAYYLIHSMEHSKRFADMDRRAAENFRDAAAGARLGRIVYLGGLGRLDRRLSQHLASRQEVGDILASGPTPVTVLRAAVIIGSGSMSFEMIRHLTDVLPVMARPTWVRTRCQPIGIRNVLAVLISVLDDPEHVDRLYDIGGPDVLTYEEMMQAYAEVAGLRRRLVIPLPIFSTRASVWFVSLATPLPAGLARPLIESLRHDVVVGKPHPPGFHPADQLPYRECVRLALVRYFYSTVETRWSDALTTPNAPMPGDPTWAGERMYSDRRVVESRADADDVLWAVSRVGGEVGYYAMNWAWRLRGWIDKLVGGVGLRRGRRHPEELRVGESLDFFRVVEMDPGRRRVTLQAEMKVPGTAWLSWQVTDTDEGSCLTQSARMAPRGLFGRAYWYAMLPFHAPIFKLMSRRMVRAAEERSEARSSARWHP